MPFVLTLNVSVYYITLLVLSFIDMIYMQVYVFSNIYLLRLPSVPGSNPASLTLNGPSDWQGHCTTEKSRGEDGNKVKAKE